MNSVDVFFLINSVVYFGTLEFIICEGVIPEAYCMRDCQLFLVTNFNNTPLAF